MPKKGIDRQEYDAKVLVLGLFPRWDQVGPLVGQVNQKLAEIADGEHVFYLHIGAKMTPEDFADRVHLGPAGYRKWGEVMGKVLEKLH